MLESDPKFYHFIAQGVITIDNLDDAEEMRLTDDAISILGFTPVKLNFTVFELFLKQSQIYMCIG